MNATVDDRELCARLEAEVSGGGWTGRRTGDGRAAAALRAVLDRHGELLRRETEIRASLRAERDRGDAIAAARRTLDRMAPDADEDALVALLSTIGTAVAPSAPRAAAPHGDVTSPRGTP